MSKFDLLIRQAAVYSPNCLGILDIGIKDGKITAMGPSLEGDAGETIDASGLKAIPGVIETHAHMLLPFGGTQTMNDFYDGTTAGLYGGVTTLIDFADQQRGHSIEEALSQREAVAKSQCAADYSFHLTLTDITPETIAAIKPLMDRGYTSFKFYTAYESSGLRVPYEDLEKAFREIARWGGIATVHAEDEDQINRAIEALKQTGETAPRFFLRSKPADSEPSAVRQLIRIAEKTGCKLLIRHVSSAEGARLIRDAQAAGLEVYGETCPHYLLLDEQVYGGEHPEDYIVNPPIRTAADQREIWDALRSTAFTIGTDDCGFYLSQKRCSDVFYEIPGGMPGIEPRLILLYEYGVRKGQITLEQLVRMTSENPAVLYGLYPAKGTISPGSDADIVLIDDHAEPYGLHARDLHEKSDYTPYEGWTLRTRVRATISAGRTAMKDGQILVHPGEGRRVMRNLPGSLVK